MVLRVPRVARDPRGGTPGLARPVSTPAPRGRRRAVAFSLRSNERVPFFRATGPCAAVCYISPLFVRYLYVLHSISFRSRCASAYFPVVRRPRAVFQLAQLSLRNQYFPAYHCKEKTKHVSMYLLTFLAPRSTPPSNHIYILVANTHVFNARRSETPSQTVYRFCYT